MRTDARRWMSMTHTSVAPNQPGPRDESGRELRRTAEHGGRLRILLVEDDEADAFLVRELFAVCAVPAASPRRWPRDAVRREALGRHYHPLAGAVEALGRWGREEETDGRPGD